MKITSLFKTLTLPLFVAAALTTACSSDDSNETTKEPALAPTTIHVSVGAEIADNGTTRATYEYDTGAGSEERYHLVFETGDKLYLELSSKDETSALQIKWKYTGYLEYQGDGVFSGDMTAVSNQGASPEDISKGIVKTATDVTAILLPNGYTADFITQTAPPTFDYHKAFATGDHKNSVAKVCEMYATSWTDGKAGQLTLEPQNPVIRFTLSGLEARKEYPVQLELTSSSWTGTYTVSGTTTSDASGVAMFSMGIGTYGMDDATTYQLNIDDQTINLGEKTLAKGKVYNLNRFVVSDAAKEYVDLGFGPVYWCKMNVGARKETDWGLIFAWGATKGYSSALGEVIEAGKTWKAADGYNFNDQEVCSFDHIALSDGFDAASKCLGWEYFMPYKGHWQQLIDNCTWTYTEDYQGSGVAGYIARSKIEGYTDKYIFLPAVPIRYEDKIFYSANFKNMSYWTQSNDNQTTNKAFYFGNNSLNASQNFLLTLEETYRTYGMCVRAVKLKDVQ